MNRQKNLKIVGISVGILACIYLIYTLILVPVQSRATKMNPKQFQVQSRATEKNKKQVKVQRQESKTNGRQVGNKTNDGSKAKRNQSIATHVDTVLAEVAKVPDFADDQRNVRTLPTKQYMLYELFWKYTMVNKFQYVCSHQVRFGPTGGTGYDVCLDKAYRPGKSCIVYSFGYTIKDTYQYACSHQVRFGHRAAYVVCLDKPYRPGKPCIVYSFGSQFLFDYEEDVIKNHQCEVHTYDPSLPIGNNVIPQGVNFHLVGLGDSVTTNSIGWKMQTFSDIRRTLKHSNKTIDLLKIDIEGGEWVSLAHALRSGELRFVKQLQIELHLWGQQRVGMSLVGKLTVLKGLYDQGFRIFYHEPFLTPKCHRQMRATHPEITLCVILSLVNTKYQPK